MAKKSRGFKRYQPAAWSDDFDAKKKGGVAPWHRPKAKRYNNGAGKAPWSDPIPRGMRGGGR